MLSLVNIMFQFLFPIENVNLLYVVYERPQVTNKLHYWII